MMKKISVLVVDDSEIFRLGVRNVFEEEKEYEIKIWEASSSSELFNLLETQKLTPDVIFLDVRLKKSSSLSGIEIAKLLKVSHPNSKLIILTAFDEKEVLQQALKAGVDGFLPKESVSEEIMESVKTVLKGTNYLGKTIAFETIQYAFNATPKRHSVLTKAEKTVFILLSESFTNQKIAEKLHISVHTVETHKSNIKNKLGVKSDVDFLAIAIQDGIDEVIEHYQLKKKFDI